MKNVSIKSLNWNRIYLEIVFDTNIVDDLYLISSTKKYKICSDYIEKNKLKMPITCPCDDTMLEAGKWQFLYKDKIINIDIEEAKTLDNKQKVYFYKKHDFSYIVTFKIDEQFGLIMYTDYMKKNNKPNKNERAIGKNKLLYNLYSMGLNIFYFIIRIEYFIFSRLFKRKNNKILFITETKDRLTGNLLALNNRIIERNLDKEFKLYYSCKKVLSDKKSFIYYIKTIYKIAKVDYVFVDDYAPIFSLIKLNNTKLIQLWHAGVGFKSVGYARFGKDGSPHPLVSTHRKYDYVVVAAPNLIPVYQEVFGLTKKHFLAPGMLRLDGYLDEQKIESIKNKLYNLYSVIKNKQVILYAPTYRGTGQKEAYYDYEKIDMEKLYKICKKNNYTVLFKFHPFIQEKINIEKKYENIFIDVSDYPDINELFYITDILITDYSSNIYEFSLFEKPIIYFDYDMDEYALLRGVHNDLENSPGNVCQTFDEIIRLLDDKKFNIEKIKKFKEENIVLSKNLACDELIKILFDK